MRNSCLLTIALSALTLILLCQAANAGDELPKTPTEIQDAWSSILYCQAIYQEPDVKSRIYAGDLESCEKSDALIRWSISRQYSPQDRQILERNARNKSTAIRYNTRNVQEAIMACRQQCRQYSAIYDRNVESGVLSGSGQ